MATASQAVCQLLQSLAWGFTAIVGPGLGSTISPGSEKSLMEKRLMNRNELTIQDVMQLMLNISKSIGCESNFLSSPMENKSVSMSFGATFFRDS